MYETVPPILKYVTTTFTNTIFTNVASAIWGSTGMRQTGSYTVLFGTLVSESWASGTKDITGIEIVYNNLATTSSIMQVSLQNMIASGGMVLPDGIVLAKWTGSIGGLTIDRLTTHSLQSSYTVTTGSRIGTVIEYIDRGPVLPSIAVHGYTTYNDRRSNVGVAIKLSTASAWQSSADFLASIRFSCSDGSKLYYDSGYAGMGGPFTVSGNYTSASTGTGIDSGDERGMLWIPKKTYDLTGFAIPIRLVDATISATDICLYRDTTLLISKSITTVDNVNNAVPIAYGMNFDTPIRVYPNDNIRLTSKPTSGGNIRWYRFSFIADEDLKAFFGGENNETNLSLTNRVNEGSWNTPPSASYSLTPVQLYGYEVTGSALLSGSYKISGSVTRLGTPISGATVRAVRQSDRVSITTASNASGNYQFGNIASGSYHVVVEYTSGSQKYNALSSWNVGAV